jgi:hypothetical protein
MTDTGRLILAGGGGGTTVRIPNAKPLVPLGTSSHELPLATWHAWIHASLPIHAFAIRNKVLLIENRSRKVVNSP